MIHSSLRSASVDPDCTAWLSVRYFRHEQPFSTAQHAHEPGQLIAVEGGLLIVETARQRLLVPARCAVWIPPGQLHGYRADGPHSGWSVYIEPPHASGLAGRSQVVTLSGLLREALKRAAAWPVPRSLDTTEEHLARVIIDEVNTLPREILTLPWPDEVRLVKIARAFVSDPSDTRTLPQWAAWSGMAARTLSRRFLAETGLSFSDWRRRVRLLTAMAMLSAGRPVTAVALELGYDSLSAFGNMFRQAIGVTPGAFADQTLRGARADLSLDRAAGQVVR